jgi:hypothetical protein
VDSSISPVLSFSSTIPPIRIFFGGSALPRSMGLERGAASVDALLTSLQSFEFFLQRDDDLLVELWYVASLPPPRYDASVRGGIPFFFVRPWPNSGARLRAPSG